MIIFRKAHPATQAMSGASKPADLNEGDIRRNPGEPDAKQAEASTYNKPRIEWRGLTIAIENPAGSVRRGRNRHGVTWEVRMRFDYGEILGTLGVDGDPVDVIVGPNLDAPTVYVVHQRKVNRWDEYDEDKCCVGFNTEEDAKQAFLSNYNDPRFLGPITAMPADEFVAKVRATRENPAMIKAAAPLVLFFKAHVGPYLRGGKLVNLSGYQGRTARAKVTPGQLTLFPKPTVDMSENRYKDKHPVHDTPDLFEDEPASPASRPSLGEFKLSNFKIKHGDAMWHDGHVYTVDGGGKVDGKPYVSASREVSKYQTSHKIFRGDEIASARYHALYGDPEHTEPTAELIKEHERLVQVLESPSHEDDKVEAKKQAKELAEYKEEGSNHRIDRSRADLGLTESQKDDLRIAGASWAKYSQHRLNGVGHNEAIMRSRGTGSSQIGREHDHLLEQIPGAQWRRGKGAIAHRYAVELNGDVVGNYHDKPEDAIAEAKQWIANKAKWSKDADDRARSIIDLRGRLLAGGEPTEGDLALLGLRHKSDLKWFIPAAAKVFGITSHAVRPHIKDMITPSRNDFGVIKEFVNSKSALQAIAASMAETPKPAYKPVTDDTHPAPIPRSLLGAIPDDKRDEWKDLHRQQHELHHYELGQVREKLNRGRIKRNKAQDALRSAEASLASLRSAPIPDPAREAEAQKYLDKTQADYSKVAKELDVLINAHNSLYEKVAKLGRQKDRIYPGSGDMDRDFASMMTRTASDQQQHEKDMLKRYREHYKQIDAEHKPDQMAKAIVFVRGRAAS